LLWGLAGFAAGTVTVIVLLRLKRRHNNPCAYVPGEYMCQDAEHLWRIVGEAYHAGDWERYEQAHAAYERHMETVNKNWGCNNG
jgi:hypothetical protein